MLVTFPLLEILTNFRSVYLHPNYLSQTVSDHLYSGKTSEICLPPNVSFLQMFVFTQFLSFTQHLYIFLAFPCTCVSYTLIVNFLKVGAVYFCHFLGFQHPNCAICWLKKGMLPASSCCRVKIGQGVVKQFFELVIVTSLELNQHLSPSSQANAWTLYRDVYKASS